MFIKYKSPIQMRQCMKRISPNTVHYSSALHLEIYIEYMHTRVTLACMQTDSMQLKYTNISLFNLDSNTKVSRRHALPTIIISLELIPTVFTKSCLNSQKRTMYTGVSYD
jgi:hypothetical protein